MALIYRVWTSTRSHFSAFQRILTYKRAFYMAVEKLERDGSFDKVRRFGPLHIIDRLLLFAFFPSPTPVCFDETQCSDVPFATTVLLPCQAWVTAACQSATPDCLSVLLFPLLALLHTHMLSHHLLSDL